jgi:hypothetical protein
LRLVTVMAAWATEIVPSRRQARLRNRTKRGHPEGGTPGKHPEGWTPNRAFGVHALACGRGRSA